MGETRPLPSEIKTNANVQYKDRLFRLIFGGKDDRSKRWLLSLYNALNDTDYTDINDIAITTIDNAIFITMKNDLSFLINSEMHLYEHQSTVNPNMLKIENPLKKIVRQRNFLGLTRKQLGARLASDGLF